MHLLVDFVNQCNTINLTMSANLSVEIFDVLHELLRIFRSRMRQSMEAVHPDLTFNEVRVLMFVGRHPGRSQKDLVEHSHTDKAQMARILTQLQDKNWLHRTESAEDRRVRCLHLSASGLALYQQLGQARAELAEQLLVQCPVEMQTQLLGLLGVARSSARATSAAADSE